MARNTAAQGAAFERQVRDDLERYGYRTMRSAASKGAADVVAFGEGEVLFVQAKLRLALVRPADRADVIDVADTLGPHIGAPLLATKDGPRTAYRLLTGPGPKDWREWSPEPLRSALCGFCEHRYGMHGTTGCWSETPCPCALFQIRPGKIA